MSGRRSAPPLVWKHPVSVPRADASIRCRGADQRGRVSVVGRDLIERNDLDGCRLEDRLRVARFIEDHVKVADLLYLRALGLIFFEVPRGRRLHPGEHERE